MPSEYKSVAESESMLSVVGQIEELKTEIETLKDASSEEYHAAYEMLARSLGDVSLMANALVEVIELDGK